MKYFDLKNGFILGIQYGHDHSEMRELRDRYDNPMQWHGLEGPDPEGARLELLSRKVKLPPVATSTTLVRKGDLAIEFELDLEKIIRTVKENMPEPIEMTLKEWLEE